MMPNGPKPSAATPSASAAGIPVSAIALVRKAAPARMNMIMQDSRVAPPRLSRKLRQDSVPVTAASSRLPATPNAAASVAVAQPANMLPITPRMSSAHGISCTLWRSFATRLMAGSAGGWRAGFSTAQTMM